jgi:peptidoglycan/LPS O-acetylase OafA/YrhL
VARSRFGSLDGLRALSVVAVVWFHTMADVLDGRLRHAGGEGVTLFFAISGFLITTLLLKERQRNGSIDLKAFYVRRAFRIFPLYFAALAVYVVLVLALESQSAAGRQFFRNLPFFLTYTSNIFVPLDGRVIFYFAWSLAAEEQFYAFWPPLFRCLTVRRATFPMALLVAAIVLAELAFNVFPTLPGARLVYGIPLAIVLGVLLALLLTSRTGFRWAWLALAATRWHCVALLGAAIAATAWLDMPRFVVHLSLVLLVAGCVLREDHALGPLLKQRLVVHIGVVSYGIYLLHMLCKNAAVRGASALGLPLEAGETFLATLVLSVATASLSYRFFEFRFLQLKRRFER